MHDMKLQSSNRSSRFRSSNLSLAAILLASTYAAPAFAKSNDAAGVDGYDAADANAVSSDTANNPAPATDGKAVEATEDEQASGEIVVTAQKRAELLSKTSLAITAISGPQLTSAGVLSVRDLTAVVPNLQISTLGLANSIMVSVRGVFNGNFNPDGNPAVSTYIDGVYVGRTTGIGAALNDVARIEVLRGPQGTLYGRNSTGGNISVVTADPTHDFDASASVGYGNYNDIQARAMVNLPVSDTLAIRLAGTHHSNDGYFDTLDTSPRYGRTNDYTARATALWTPSSNFRWRLSVDNYHNNGAPPNQIENDTNGKPIDGLPVYKRPMPTTTDPLARINQIAVRSRIDWDLSGNVALHYIGGYQHLALTTQYALASGIYDARRNERTSSNYQELNLSYEDGKFSNIAGANYFRQKVLARDIYRLYIFSLVNNPGYKPGHNFNTSWGVFDQAKLHLTDRLSLTGGIRYSQEKQSYEASQTAFCPLSLYPDYQLTDTQFFGPGCSLASSLPNQGKWSSVTWKANTEFQANDHIFLYAGATTGFKSGGLNNPATGVPSYKPEKVINYEAGLKLTTPSRVASLNASVFYIKYTDIQVYGFVGLNGVTTNAAGAKSYGIELDGTLRPTDHDLFTGFFVFNRAVYTKYNDGVDQLTGTRNLLLTGNQLPHAPAWSMRGEYSHTFDLANGATLVPKAAVYWQSKSYLRDINDSIDLVKPYTKTTLNLTYTNASKNVSVEAYVYNLENRLIRNFAFTAIGSYFVDYEPPRTYGVRVTWNY